MEREYRHHPSRGRLYMLDDAASRKSGNDDALGRTGRCTFTHKLCVKNEAGSPKRGEAPLSKKDAPQGSRDGKVWVRRVFPGQFLMSKNPGTNSTYVDLAGMLILLFKVPAS